MIRRNIVMVLPKLSSYENKEEIVKMGIRELVDDWYNKLRDKELTITCFAEDLLACELLKDRDGIEWQTTLSMGDRMFWLNNQLGRDPYDDIEVKQKYKNIVTEARNKIANKAESLDRLSEEYTKKRIECLRDRIRYVADNIVGKSQLCIYFNANNNFCAKPEPKEGDGKLIITASLNTGVGEIYYGGYAISTEVFDQVVRSI